MDLNIFLNSGSTSYISTMLVYPEVSDIVGKDTKVVLPEHIGNYYGATYILCYACLKVVMLSKIMFLLAFLAKRMAGKCTEVSSLPANCNDFHVVCCIIFWDEIVVNVDASGWSMINMDNK